MAQNWDFVPPQSSDTLTSDAESRRFVRRRAMKEFRERQRLDRAKTIHQPEDKNSQTKDLSLRLIVSKGSPHPSSASPLISTSQGHNSRTSALRQLVRPVAKPRTHVFLAQEQEVVGKRNIQVSTSRICLRSVRYHPLDSLGKTGGPLENTTRKVLFDHFVTVLSRALYPLGFNKNRNPLLLDWVNRALAEPAILEATLFHSAVHLDWIYKRRWSHTTRYHQGELLRELTGHMKTPGQEASDTVIVAVIMLAGTGNVTGEFTGTEMHWKALLEMVKRRGGVKRLRTDGMMAVFLSGLDVISATLTLSKPCFEWHETEQSGNLTPPNSLWTSHTFEAELRAILATMADLSTRFDIVSPQLVISSSEIKAIYLQRASLEYRLLCLPTTSANNSQTILQAQVFNACRVVGLLCINYLFRELSPVLSTFVRLKQHLENILNMMELCNVRELDTSSKQLLLWIHFVGGMVSCDKKRFAGTIAPVMDVLELSTWEETKTCLECQLFPVKMHDRNCSALWHEIQVRLLPRTDDSL